MKKPKINNALAMAQVFDKLKKVIPPVKEDAPANSVAGGGVDMAPTMGPRKKNIIGGVELTNMTDGRRSAKKLPILLKIFRKYIEQLMIRLYDDRGVTVDYFESLLEQNQNILFEIYS